jgi:hypothetical protein
MNLPTPNGWPKQGEQSDGSWIEYTFESNSSRLRTYKAHRDYTSYLLARRGGNKDRLLVRCYLAAGHDPKDYQAVTQWLADHSGRKWTFGSIHKAYDHTLPLEHRGAKPND